MDIKPILWYDELRYMLMVGHEYVPEKGFWTQQWFCKNEYIMVDIFYASEGRLGDRSKPRVPVQKDQTFVVLLKIEGVFRAFAPIDISEGGFSIAVTDVSIVPNTLNRSLYFKITGREELSGVSGTARLVGIMEKSTYSSKLAFGIDVDDANFTKIRLYAVNTIKRLLSGT